MKIFHAYLIFLFEIDKILLKMFGWKFISFEICTIFTIRIIWRFLPNIQKFCIEVSRFNRILNLHTPFILTVSFLRSTGKIAQEITDQNEIGRENIKFPDFLRFFVKISWKFLVYYLKISQLNFAVSNLLNRYLIGEIFGKSRII